MNNKDTATTILNQLGGNKFIAMTGAKDFLTGGNDITFKIGKNSSKANMINIILDEDDTYTMKFIKFTNFRMTKTFEFIEAKTEVLKEVKGIYCDMLQDLFTQYTGLYTHI